jgi:hypothetical protein
VHRVVRISIPTRELLARDDVKSGPGVLGLEFGLGAAVEVVVLKPPCFCMKLSFLVGSMVSRAGKTRGAESGSWMSPIVLPDEELNLERKEGLEVERAPTAFVMDVLRSTTVSAEAEVGLYVIIRA